MGFSGDKYQCPGCAEFVDIGAAIQCPLCDTPVVKQSGGQNNTVFCRSCKMRAPLDASTCPHCGKLLVKSGGGCFIIAAVLLFLLIFVVGILAAIAVPNFKKARERANLRACYANQKTLAGATEMYQLDYNVDVEEITPQFIQKLKTDGYLQSVPTCPGNSQIVNPYSFNSSQNITCKKHGSVSGRR